MHASGDTLLRNGSRLQEKGVLSACQACICPIWHRKCPRTTEIKHTLVQFQDPVPLLSPTRCGCRYPIIISLHALAYAPFPAVLTPPASPRRTLHQPLSLFCALSFALSTLSLTPCSPPFSMRRPWKSPWTLHHPSLLFCALSTLSLEPFSPPFPTRRLCNSPLDPPYPLFYT